MKTKAMNESWTLIKEYKMSKSKALKQGWLLAKTYKQMTTRKYVMFEFLKADGKTIRRAMGTLHPLFIPPTKGQRVPPQTTQVFFDIECGEWRSYRKSNLLRILM